MRKSLLIGILTLLTFSVFSQDVRPDNFKVGNFLEVFGKDSLRVYFSCTGVVVDKKCASFYRVGKMDTAMVTFAGAFTDYDVRGNLYLKATLINNKMEGYAAYYFSNGKISEEGHFQNNVRVGKWTYYYPNGGIEKVYSYESDEPTVLEAYKRNGKATVINGNGALYTEFRNYNECSCFETGGNLVNGKKQGEWTFSNIKAITPIATEIYEEGIFVKGISGRYVYTEKPAIKLTKYYPNEDLNLVSNHLLCPGESISYWKYEGEDLTRTFYPQLQEEVNKMGVSVKNQWLLVGIKIGKDDGMQEVNIASSINDTALENRIYAILQKMQTWEAARRDQRPITSSLFFSILVDNNRILVLPYQVYKNRLYPNKFKLPRNK